MSLISRPAISLPEPLRAAEIPSFTNYSVVVRLPEIARRTLAENSFPADTVARIEQLIAEIPEGKIRQLDIPLEADAVQWAVYVRPYEEMNWLDVPWFFAEEYFYMRILEATGYFGPGEGHGLDPYAHQKRMGLESTRDSLHNLAEDIEYALKRPAFDGAITNGTPYNGAASAYRDSLARLLLMDLWGNQNDLSLWPVLKSQDGSGMTGGTAGRKDDESAGLRSAQEHILANDLSVAESFIAGLDGGSARIDILLDNAGYELVADLALADFLITSGHAAYITLHAKSHPVFVSDALEKDVFDTLDFLALEGHTSTQGLAVRLRSSLLDDHLRVRHHPFWTSPLAAWDMPADLAYEISQASLMIAKGDANYRRLLGDRHWPFDLPFNRVVNYLPCAVLALRTLKSEIATGIDPQRVPTNDPDWMINGRWGLVQFARARS